MDAPKLVDVIRRNIHNISWNKTKSEIILFWGYFKGDIVIIFRGDNILCVGRHIEKSSMVESLKNEVSAIVC